MNQVKLTARALAFWIDGIALARRGQCPFVVQQIRGDLSGNLVPWAA